MTFETAVVCRALKRKFVATYNFSALGSDKKRKRLISTCTSTLMCFLKCPFSSRRKRNKIFSSASVFPYLFHPHKVKRSKTLKATGPWDCACLKVQPTLQDHLPSWKDAPIWMRTGVFARCLVLMTGGSASKTMRF